MRRYLPLALLLLSGCAPRKSDAYAACQRFVRAKLSYAGSAVFPPLSDPEVRATLLESRSGYEFRGVVDAANGFGALRRVEYRCTAIRHDDGEWHRGPFQLGDGPLEWGRDLD